VLAPTDVSLEQEVRSIFISDLHLGSRFARVEKLLELLSLHSPEFLYLVGDIVDGWILKRKWHWPEIYNQLLDRLVVLANSGTIIRLTPGNHDEFLRRFLLKNELVSIENEFIHEGADNRRFVIMHGDRFDEFEAKAKALSMIGGFGYEVILRVDYWANVALRLCGCRRRRISQTVKQRIKLAVKFVSGFEQRAAQHASEQQCDVVVCGHIHVPSLNQVGDVLYINLGDWIENSTALIEYGDGRLRLIEMGCDEAIAESPPMVMNRKGCRLSIRTSDPICEVA